MSERPDTTRSNTAQNGTSPHNNHQCTFARSTFLRYMSKASALFCGPCAALTSTSFIFFITSLTVYAPTVFTMFVTACHRLHSEQNGQRESERGTQQDEGRAYSTVPTGYLAVALASIDISSSVHCTRQPANVNTDWF